jgi:membrane protease YdiL (CAAX protease family)
MLLSEFLLRVIYDILLELPEVKLSQQKIKEGSLSTSKILFIIILGPFLETLFFQTFFIGFIKKFIKVKYALLLSAVLFSIAHTYSIMYLIKMFFIGILLSSAYLVFEFKKVSATYYTFLIHSIRNGLAIVAYSFMS